MKGLELSRKFWEELGYEAFKAGCPKVLDRAVIGLVGEGSECFGFDDEVSHDHDFGPGFCVWLEEEDMQEFGEQAIAVYNSLPRQFLGYERLRQNELSIARTGVMTSKSFYYRYTGRESAPVSIRDWRMIPKNAFPILTNGEIFLENEGYFMDFRKVLQGYFPDDLRLKKLAKECALAAQQGQYNYLRCLRHGENTAALIAFAEFVGSAQQIIFLLEKQYAPYYKWTQKKLRTLSPLGEHVAALIDDAVEAQKYDKIPIIEEICQSIITELQKRCLSLSESTFLLDHAPRIQALITDENLKRLPLMAE